SMPARRRPGFFVIVILWSGRSFRFPKVCHAQPWPAAPGHGSRPEGYGRPAGPPVVRFSKSKTTPVKRERDHTPYCHGKSQPTETTISAKPPQAVSVAGEAGSVGLPES